MTEACNYLANVRQLDMLCAGIVGALMGLALALAISLTLQAVRGTGNPEKWGPL